MHLHMIGVAVAARGVVSDEYISPLCPRDVDDSRGDGIDRLVREARVCSDSTPRMSADLRNSTLR